MSRLPVTIAIALLGAAPANAMECIPREGLCGSTVIDAGWQVVAQCRAGHGWAAVIVKNNERLFCTGLSAYHGPVEFPCRPFNGDIDRFRSIAAMSGNDLARARTCWGEAQQSLGAR